MTEERTNAEKLKGIGREILVLARNELYLKMRFLDVALSSFYFAADPAADPAGTDGFSICYHPENLSKMYRKDAVLVNRLYLHMVLHCLFHHLTRRNGRDEDLWNLSCDIVAESMIDSMQHRPVLRSRSFLRRDVPEAEARDESTDSGKGIRFPGKLESERKKAWRAGRRILYGQSYLLAGR